MPATPSASRGPGRRGDVFLKKPLEPQALLRELERLLGGPPVPSAA